MDSFDDPVIYEADVKFAPKRKGDLYLFQFSHNSSPFSIKKQSSCLGSIKAKSKSNQFEIELLMNTQSDTFDEDKSKRIAFNVDDSQQHHHQEQSSSTNTTTTPDKYFPNNLMNKQLLNSEKLTSTAGFQFALGYIRQDLDEIKLIPIKNVIEFKPAFQYLDKVKIKTSNKNQDESDEDDDELMNSKFEQQQHQQQQQQDNTATKKVTMRFEDKRKSSNTTDHHQSNNQDKKIENEEWKLVQYFDYGLPKFEREKEQILYNKSQNVIIDDDDDDDEPIIKSIDKFSYGELASNSNDKQQQQQQFANSDKEELKIDLLNTLPFYRTSTLPLKDQIRSILCSSKVISFNKCVQLLNLNFERNRLYKLNNNNNSSSNNHHHHHLSNGNQSNSSNDQQLDLNLVLKYLQQYAQLVQGNWVVRSDIIYPKTFNSSASFDLNSIPFTSVSVDMLCKARDYVLYKFTKQISLSRLELIEQIRVPPNLISEILAQFSIFNKKTRSWEFKYERDEQFIANYADIVNKQQIIWQSAENQLLNLFD